VLVDENGQVIDAAVVGNHGFGFGDNALKAARQTTFFPATKDGVKVKMQFTLTFKFVNQQ
jgi:TonB family protein